MATFMFKIDRQQVTMENLPEGPLKQMFVNLKTSIANQLRPLKCKTHRHEPVVMLQSDGGKAKLSGVSTCCTEFGSTVRERLKLPEDIMDPNVTITNRDFVHPEES